MSGFADYLEPFCAGFIACREGLSGDDGEAFMAAAMRAFENSGPQRAKRFLETGDPSEIPALLRDELAPMGEKQRLPNRGSTGA